MLGGQVFWSFVCGHIEKEELCWTPNNGTWFSSGDAYDQILTAYRQTSIGSMREAVEETIQRLIEEPPKDSTYVPEQLTPVIPQQPVAPQVFPHQRNFFKEVIRWFSIFALAVLTVIVAGLAVATGGVLFSILVFPSGAPTIVTLIFAVVFLLEGGAIFLGLYTLAKFLGL